MDTGYYGTADGSVGGPRSSEYFSPPGQCENSPQRHEFSLMRMTVGLAGGLHGQVQPSLWRNLTEVGFRDHEKYHHYF